MSRAVILGTGQTPYRRHVDPQVTTDSLLADAFCAAVADAQLAPDHIDGLAVASFTLKPDHVIDLAWRLGLRLRWIMQDTNGGASGINMLQHAVRAIEAGDARHVVVLAGDRMTRDDFARLAGAYNRFTVEQLAPLPYLGPNTQFAFVTQRHMAALGLEREDYGTLAVSQRAWAARNPNAAYRQPLTIEEYLDAPEVAPPLRRYDCVPVVSGADAVVVSSGNRGVVVRGVVGAYTTEDQNGDGLRTGLADASDRLWAGSGVEPADVDLACVYDDYPVMVFIQLADLGLVAPQDLTDFARRRLLAERWPLNTSGGMLSAGQAGAAGGLMGLVEAASQLLGRAGGRQVAARTAVVSGYGMVVARFGAAANATVLQRK